MVKLKLEHKVITSVIPNVAAWSEAVIGAITKIADQFRIRLLSELIKSIWRVLQNYLDILMESLL